MKFNKVFKGLLIALPILSVAACSSSDEAANAASQETTTNQLAETEATLITPIDQESILLEQEMQKAINANNTVHFAFDNAVVSADYEDMLAHHAAFLSDNPETKATIEGHADERGTPEYNIALGERRAEAISKYLQALGVQSDQISIVSYGEEKPLVLDQSEKAYAKNRRAVIVY